MTTNNQAEVRAAIVLGIAVIFSIAAIPLTFSGDNSHSTTHSHSTTPTTAAPTKQTAQQDTRISTVAIIAVYNDHCEKIRDNILFPLMVGAFSENENAFTAEVEKLTPKFGGDWWAFCLAYKPLVVKAIANF